jgi:hypothetical protein
MRAFLATLDRMTLVAVVAGAVVGALWLVNLPLGLAATGIAAPLGVVLLVMRARWLETGAYVAAIGLVPGLAYRIGGPPPLPNPLPDDIAPIELMAPGAAYLFFVVGTIVIVVATVFELRSGRRREGLDARRSTREGERLGGRAP